MALAFEDRPLVAGMAALIYGARIISGASVIDGVTVASEAIALLDCVDRHLPTLLRKRAMDRNPKPKAQEIDAKGRF